jgi:CheY-like chemotaxis protein
VANWDRILVVEDDRDTLSGLFMLLTHAGFTVLTAEHGAQAVDLLAHGIRPRVILLDLMMPKVTGWDVLKHLQTDPDLRGIPVVVMTAAPETSRPVIGADVVLRKPIEPDKLIAEVARLMDAGPGEKPTPPLHRDR